MALLPYELHWGVDVAIKKLRPNAKFTLCNTTFTDWYDPSGSEPPTWQEIIDQIESDKKIADEWLQGNQEEFDEEQNS